MSNKSTGFMPFHGYKTYYEVHGDLNNNVAPLVALHGGPGYPHYHLETLSKLANHVCPVILYDQLGCGLSDQPDDPKLWNVQLFVDELAAIRQHLGLDSIHILGHSWGGSLAVEYVLTKLSGVQKLILSSPLLDSKLWVDEADRLKDDMPQWAADIMRECEAKGTTDSYEYEQAYAEFRKRFVCRKEPYPSELIKADSQMGAQVYTTMWGPSEAFATGKLKNWSVLDRLDEIDVPTLLLSGRHDEATPTQLQIAKDKIRNSKWIVFENSSHTANLEEPEAYLDAVSNFLRPNNL